MFPVQLQCLKTLPSMYRNVLLPDLADFVEPNMNTLKHNIQQINNIAYNGA